MPALTSTPRVMPSSPPPSSPARIAAYNLAAPTESDAVAALGRVFGEARARTLWADACRNAGLAPGQVRDGPALERAGRALAAEGGAAATVARSIAIRMRTYSQLAARGAAPTSHATGARS